MNFQSRQPLRHPVYDIGHSSEGKSRYCFGLWDRLIRISPSFVHLEGSPGSRRALRRVDRRPLQPAADDADGRSTPRRFGIRMVLVVAGSSQSTDGLITTGVAGGTESSGGPWEPA
jgi:hypothetical protein